MSPSNMQTLHCSFCRKSQGAVGKLISSPADSPRAYICDECVQKYTPEEQQCLLSGPLGVPNRPTHCLMCHPDALQLLAAIERWALAEWERRDSDRELAEVRRMALAMLGMDPA
jgi:ClpX C4-type zinc finger